MQAEPAIRKHARTFPFGWNAPVRPVSTDGLHGLNPLLAYMSGYSGLLQFWGEAATAEPATGAFERMLRLLDIEVRCTEYDLSRIPEHGPALLIANHPHGLLDGLAIASLVARRRTDLRFLANSVLQSVPGLGKFVIPVDVFQGSRSRNASAIRASLRWLRGDGLLIGFPAGEVSAPRGISFEVKDKAWSDVLVKIASAAPAKIVRAFISGRNSLGFQLGGLAHPTLRTSLLGRELLNKRGYSIEVVIGKASAPQPEHQDGEYWKLRTYLLSGRVQGKGAFSFHRSIRPIVPSLSIERLKANIESLHPDCLLLRSGEFAVMRRARPRFRRFCTKSDGFGRSRFARRAKARARRSTWTLSTPTIGTFSFGTRRKARSPARIGWV